MQYTKEIYRREFTDKVSKNAYLKVCKWLAQNVYVSPSYSENIVAKIQKQESRKIKENGKEVEIFVFRLILYYSSSLDNSKDRFCNNCRQMHETFYSNKPHCSECKLKVFIQKMDSEVEGIVNSLGSAFGGNDGKTD